MRTLAIFFLTLARLLSTCPCNLRELIHMANERLCSKAQWEIRELVQQMVYCVNADLWFMLVPKCKSGRIICNSPCRRISDEQSGETQS